MKEYVFILQGETPESAEHDLAKEIEAVSSKYGLESYLDDVKEGNKDGEQCGHGNSWSANCSDCDEQELYDRVLRESLGEVYNMLTECLGDIVHDKVASGQKHNSISTDIVNRVEKDIYNRIAWQQKESEVE